VILRNSSSNETAKAYVVSGEAFPEGTSTLDGVKIRILHHEGDAAALAVITDNPFHASSSITVPSTIPPDSHAIAGSQESDESFNEARR